MYSRKFCIENHLLDYHDNARPHNTVSNALYIMWTDILYKAPTINLSPHCGGEVGNISTAGVEWLPCACAVVK